MGLDAVTVDGMQQTTRRAAPWAPKLYNSEASLDWVASQLIPAVRAANADRCARRRDYTPPAGDVGSGEWFASAITETMATYHVDSEAQKRRRDDRNEHLTQIGYVSHLMFVQFTSVRWWAAYMSWFRHADVGTSVRRHIEWQNRMATSWTNGQRSRHIMTGTDTKIAAQIANLAQHAVGAETEGVVGLQCELIVGGASLAEAIEVAGLVGV